MRLHRRETGRLHTARRRTSTVTLGCPNYPFSILNAYFNVGDSLHSSTVVVFLVSESLTAKLCKKMVHRTEVGVDSCPFSVEVVAKQAGDGKMQTKPYSSSSILDRCPDSDPALVPVGSCSESDNSSEEGETPSTVSHSRRKQLKVTPSALGVVPTAPVGADDAGVIDCLSDQFSNLFCPADAIHRGKDSPKSEPYRGCTALHFEDLVGHPGMLSFCRGDVDGLSETMNHKPTNRVSISRKRRAAHVTNLWNEWHTDSAIPLEKSKSMPSSPSPSMQDLQFDVFYDSDPEQEHREKSERLQRLEDPPKIRRSYKSRRPPPIDTIFEDECFDIEAPPRPCAPRSIYHPGFNFDPKPLPYESPVVNVARPSYLDSPLGLPEFALVHPGGDEYLKNFVQVSYLCGTKASVKQKQLLLI